MLAYSLLQMTDTHIQHLKTLAAYYSASETAFSRGVAMCGPGLTVVLCRQYYVT
jgi:hypothetical protein